MLMVIAAAIPSVNNIAIVYSLSDLICGSNIYIYIYILDYIYIYIYIFKVSEKIVPVRLAHATVCDKLAHVCECGVWWPMIATNARCVV